MAAQSRTISPDLGKPDTAVPVANGCALPRAAASGDVTASPFQTEPTIDGALYLAAEILWPEPWAAAHNRELWNFEITRDGQQTCVFTIDC